MLFERPAIERRILDAVEAIPPRIPVIVGGCGSGRTTLLNRLGARIGPQAEYIDIERVATTPERFLTSISESTRCVAPAPPSPAGAPGAARRAFDQACAFFDQARTRTGTSVTFLLDEVLDIRTFESFPGLRGVLRDLWRTLGDSPNRFVLTTRFSTRARRILQDAPERFEFVHLPPLSPAEAASALHRLGLGAGDNDQRELSRIVHALTTGRPRYLRLIAEATAAMGDGDPVSALAAQLAPDAPLSMACRFSYELRLHRARGYGALKAILQVLSREEPLTLTEIALRLGRTPGSTKDYLSWLEDVDLVDVRHKRYTFADPLLRLWVHLHGCAAPPDDDDLSREARDYVVSRFPYMEPAPAPPPPPVVPPAPRQRRDSWNMIEID